MSEYPKRPPRLTTLFSGVKPFYFVTFNTHDRREILASDTIHSKFLEFCIEAKNHGVFVGTYVIMSEHIHLFVWINLESCDLKKWIKSLKCFLSVELEEINVKRPHWQIGFFDHVLRSSDSYREKSIYMMNNPVRAELCKTPDEWKYKGTINNIYWSDYD
ncbi:MAG: transposase [Victivallales bacterium]|jgi:REP element-mobilizing transposase RayT